MIGFHSVLVLEIPAYVSLDLFVFPLLVVGRDLLVNFLLVSLHVLLDPDVVGVQQVNELALVLVSRSLILEVHQSSIYNAGLLIDLDPGGLLMLAVLRDWLR